MFDKLENLKGCVIQKINKTKGCSGGRNLD